MLIITEPFQWSPNGYDIKLQPAGEFESLPEDVIAFANNLKVLKASKEPEPEQKKVTTPVTNAKNKPNKTTAVKP